MKLWKIAHDPLETVVKYWNNNDQMNCSRNGKNQAMMVSQLKKDPSSYQDFWNGFSYEDFLLSSPILASQELPKEWEALDISKVRQGRAVWQTVSGGDWLGINPYLLQLALGNYEEKRRIKEEKRKQQKEKERKQQKAERLRKREMLFSYDGLYNVYLSLKRNSSNGAIDQGLGSITFSLSRGQPKFDENNLSYNSLGLNEVNLSLDYDGSAKISGNYIGINSFKKQCFYLSGNLKSEKAFQMISGRDCSESSQNLQLMIRKISDDVNEQIINQKDFKD